MIRTPKLYLREATVMIVNDDHLSDREFISSYTARSINSKSLVDNEISILRSNRLMEMAVRQLNLDMSYTFGGGLHRIELYNHTPILLHFADVASHQSYTLKAKLLTNQKIQLWDFEIDGIKEEKMIIIQLNEAINTPFGKLVAAPTRWFEDRWIGTTITVHKSSVEKATDYFHNTVKIKLAQDFSSVVHLSLKDVSVARADDILNTLIALYVKESTEYKRQITNYTEGFINERLYLIEQGLEIDKDITKRGGELNNIESHEMTLLQHQYTMINFIKTYLENPAKDAELLPAIGIEELGIEKQISFYNQQLLKRNQLVQNAENNMQMIDELNQSLKMIRQNIKELINNLLVSLDLQIQEITVREQMAKNQINAEPESLKQISGIVDQQQMKESLCMYLLQKREQNALKRAAIDNHVRYIDDAYGSPEPVAPKAWLVFSIAIFVSIFLPALLILLFGRTTDDFADRD